MTREARPVAELAAVQRLWRRHLTGKPTMYQALLNALLAEVEAPPVRDAVVEGISRLLQDLLLSVGANSAAAKLPALIEKLVAASSHLACAPLDDDPDEYPPYALGSNAADLVHYFHRDLGLSVLFLYNYLGQRRQMSKTMPAEELLCCIARVIQAPRHPDVVTGR